MNTNMEEVDEEREARDVLTPLRRIRRRKRVYLAMKQTPTPLIKDDVDFQATYGYILSLRRDVSTDLHPGAWEDVNLPRFSNFVTVTQIVLSCEDTYTDILFTRQECHTRSFTIP